MSLKRILIITVPLLISVMLPFTGSAGILQDNDSIRLSQKLSEARNLIRESQADSASGLLRQSIIGISIFIPR